MKKVTARAKSIWQLGLVISTLVLILALPKSVHAAAFTCLWTGGGDGANFSDAANWTNCNGSAPANGSNLVFDTTGMNDYVQVTNDLSSLSINKITFQGTNDDGYGYSLYGNAIALSGGITDATNGNASIDLPLNLTSDQTFNVSGDLASLYLGNEVTSTLNIGSHTLNITAFADDSAVYPFDTLTGSGTVNFSAPALGYSAHLNEDASAFTGTFNIALGQVDVSAPNNLSPVANVVNSGADISITSFNGQTISAPISLTGTGADPTENNWGAAIETLGGVGSGDVTLTHVSLAGNIQAWVDDGATMTFTGLTSNGYSLLSSPTSLGTLVGGVSGTGSNQAQIVTTVPSSFNNSSDPATVSNNQELVMNGGIGSTTVNGGGVLKGDGTVSDLAVNPDGTVSPGHSPGCLTVTNNFHEGGIYQAELGGTTACTGFDQIISGGTVTLNNGGSPPTAGSLQVMLVDGFQPQVGQSFEIIKNNSASAVSGTFLNLPEGAKFTADGYTFSITYKGGDGNDVVINVLSVPAASGALPSAPNTGFGSSAGKPLMILVLAGVASGAFGVLAGWKHVHRKTKFALYR